MTRRQLIGIAFIALAGLILLAEILYTFAKLGAQ